MKLLGLPFVLRVVGVSVLLLVAFQYIVLGAFLVPPLVIAAFVIGLSFVAESMPRVVAGIALLTGVVVPTLAYLGYSAGNVPGFVVAFDVVVFAWLFVSALRVLRYQLFMK